MQPLLDMAVLGPPRISLGGRPLAGPLSGKPLALLIYLAVSGQPQPRHALASLLWGDVPEENA